MVKQICERSFLQLTLKHLSFTFSLWMPNMGDFFVLWSDLKRNFCFLYLPHFLREIKIECLKWAATVTFPFEKSDNGLCVLVCRKVFCLVYFCQEPLAAEEPIRIDQDVVVIKEDVTNEDELLLNEDGKTGNRKAFFTVVQEQKK